MNTFFQFKQFTIHQDQCAMKVTEIACIQGAWTRTPSSAKTVLDIGCGTGLLSLMTAQKYPAIKIDAVEIDETCFKQAKENIENSVFRDQINCIHDDIKNFVPPYEYDFIITNPPFFEQHLKTADKQKNMAWHSDALTLKELLQCIDRLLKAEGSFSILLPSQREDDMLKICINYSFFPTHILQIRHSEKHTVSHQVYIFSRTETVCQKEMFTIKEDGKYTDSFVNLLGEFYLKL